MSGNRRVAYAGRTGSWERSSSDTSGTCRAMYRQARVDSSRHPSSGCAVDRSDRHLARSHRYMAPPKPTIPTTSHHARRQPDQHEPCLPFRPPCTQCRVPSRRSAVLLASKRKTSAWTRRLTAPWLSWRWSAITSRAPLRYWCSSPSRSPTPRWPAGTTSLEAETSWCDHRWRRPATPPRRGSRCGRGGPSTRRSVPVEQWVDDVDELTRPERRVAASAQWAQRTHDAFTRATRPEKSGANR